MFLFDQLDNENLKNRLTCLSGETKKQYWKKMKGDARVKRIKPGSNPPIYEYRNAELHWYDNDSANIFYYDTKIKFWNDSSWLSD